ncbi:MAG: RES family NAD+ phosphorylase [Candidatus Aquilonibacter sp.]
MKTIARRGRYYRVCDPSWNDCCDGRFAAEFGGRWNPPQSFPTLYVNRNIETARANARRIYEGEAFGLFDLNPVMRPHLQIVELTPCEPVDAVSDDGLRALGLPATYPDDIGWDVCQPIGVRAHDSGAVGISARSAALAGGEELTLFALALARKRQRILFDLWYLAEPKNLEKS